MICSCPRLFLSYLGLGFFFRYLLLPRSVLSKSVAVKSCCRPRLLFVFHVPADPQFDSRFRREYFSRSSHTMSYLKIGTPVVTLPGAWHYRVSDGTGWPGVSIL